MTQKQKQKPVGWLTHVFFIVFFLVVPTIATVRPPGEPAFTIDRVFIQDTLANAALLCFFYFNYYVLIPNVYFKRHYFRYVIYVILFLSLFLSIPHLIGTHIPGDGVGGAPPEFPGPPHGPQPQGPPPHEPQPQGPPGAPPLATLVFDEFRRHLFLFFTAVFFSFLLRTREHLSQLKEEKVRAELLLLKSQINPHFLFNTLNSIYVLSTKNDPRTSSAIINLSGLMRYVIKEATDDKIPLYKELEYIGNYIDLQRARLGDTTRILSRQKGDPEGKEITPLLLITYIENAFKYGVNPDVADCFVEIDIRIEETTLAMSVINKKVPHARNIDSTGIGIANTAERLQLLYPGKHHVDIKEDDKTYSITLSLELL